MLPRRIKVERVQSAQRIRSPSHLRWVASHYCVVPECHQTPIHAHHVRLGSDGGGSLKPSDTFAVSLCATQHHQELHNVGELSFQLKYGIDLLKLAAEFATKSPKLRRSTMEASRRKAVG